ncbi:YidC/Oxa1 family membrane protein insertase [Leucobacter insecticola]|uniref:Membrane protein insertase YidC n=1 Tax=Leucobacter insecticola TaxID=2714934 RepID=A0A6G8FJG8_9MICO|nr:YidC/Oxa1 family membrane protein insertase [Leucobacter insecticola]QIM16515.1 YidC/Oxa1 family membrane protein insertase [Leucobacter insecticola]
MNIYEFPPVKLLVDAAYWLVNHLSDLLTPIADGSSAVLAIVLLTFAVRAALIPVGRSQARANITRQRIAPQLAELQRKYAKNPEVLQRKTMELYAKEKASPFAGCLPVLAQMPVLMAVYGIFIQPTIHGEANTLLGHTFLGIRLNESYLGILGSGNVEWSAAAVFLSIMAIIAVVAQLSRRLLMRPAQATARTPKPAPAAGMLAGMPDLSRLTSALSFMPFITAIVAAVVPLAAAVYLMTTVTWTLGERLILNRVYQATIA